MNTFKDREKSFEKKYAHDEEKIFKINARRNKYLGEWVAEKIKLNEEEKKNYIEEVIKSDFSEPGDQDVFRKLKEDLLKAGFNDIDEEIRNKMNELMERAKKDFS